MFKKKPEVVRQQLIINCLKERKSASLADIMAYVNNRLEDYFDAAVTKNGYGKSTFEKTLKDLRANLEFEIEHFVENGIHLYRLNNQEFVPFLTETEKHGLGFLLRLIDIYDDLDAVKWLKEMLRTEFQIDTHHYTRAEHFVMSHPIINDHEKLLALSMKIIGHIERQEVIRFTYKKVNNEAEHLWKYIAPLQIRYFEGRYYLIGCEMNEDNTFKPDFGTYPLDQIIDGYIAPVPDENIEDEEYFIHFNHKEMVQRTELHSRYQDSLGIITDRNRPQTIRIRFKNWAKSHVLNRKLHHSQKIIDMQVNHVDIEICVRKTVELDFQLARFRDQYEFITP